MNQEGYLAALDLAAMIARNVPADRVATKDIGPNVSKLGRIASSLHKRYEAACSYAWADTDMYAQATEALEAKATALGAVLGIEVTHQRDPRDWPVICKVGDRETRLG